MEFRIHYFLYTQYSEVSICLNIYNENLKTPQQNIQVPRVSKKMSIYIISTLDVTNNIYFEKLLKNWLYSKYWNLLLHKLHIPTMCLYILIY